MIIDFGELKEKIHSYIELYLDHQYLNELIPNPTAELLAIHLWKHLEMKIDNRNVLLYKIKMFGLQYAENSKFQQMAKTHPKHWNYCINKLGCGEVLDYIRANLKNKKLAEKFNPYLGM